MAPQPKKDETPGQDVAELKTRGTELEIVDFGEDAGKGMENLERGELIVPFLTILQKNSPEVEPVSQGGVEGAKPGLLINKATKAVYDTASFKPIFIPVKRDHNWPEFTPRDEGGGFHGLRAPTDPEVLALLAEQGRFKKLVTERGTEFAETYYLYGLLIDAYASVSRVVIGFASTQIKKYSAVVSRLDDIRYPDAGGALIRVPIWAHRWELTTVPEKNKKGAYFGWQITMPGVRTLDALVRMGDPLYSAAKAFNTLLETGQAKAAPPQSADLGEQDGDEIPF